MASPTALARPPFNVDDKDVSYSNHDPQARSHVRNNNNSDARNRASESTYNTYDNYLSTKNDMDDDRRGSRDSAHEGIGGGLLSGLADDSDYSDDESEEETITRAKTATKAPAPPAPVAAASVVASRSKNQALFEAAMRDSEDEGRTSSSTARHNATLSPAPPAYEEVGGLSSRSRPSNEQGRRLSPPSGPLEVNHQQRQPPPNNLHPHPPNNGPGNGDNRGPSPTPSITPPPAAPLQVPPHQMNAPQPTRPIQPPPQGPNSHLHPMQLPRGPPQALTINTGIRGPSPQQHWNGPYPGPPRGIPGQPFGMPFHMTPTPLPDDVTSSPIVPAFIKPTSIKFADRDGGEKSPSVLSHESSIPILRGDKEDTLPVRSGPGVGPRPPKVGQAKGHDGDDFWRRFSMVAKKEKTMSVKDKRSTWLQSAQRHTNAFNRWTWCIGMGILILVVGGSVATWWFTHASPAHAIPVAFGGGARETMGASTTLPTPIYGGATTTSKAKGKATQKTNQKRGVDVDVPSPTITPAPEALLARRKRHLYAAHHVADVKHD